VTQPLARAEIVTFGCRLNAYESEVVAKLAADAGLFDTVIVNTCAVTAEAERQARQTIRRLKRERPTASIVVTGCAAQINPDRFAAMPEVARVIGNAEKLKPSTWHNSAPVQVADIMQLRETAPHLLPAFAEHTRAFVEVQQGCDHRCTFCIIPFGRGPSRSAPLGTVVDHVRHYVSGGAREVVLTGVDLTSWGLDLPGQPGLSSLIRRLLNAIPELSRLRLSSIDPAEIDDELFDLFAAEKRLMPHLHLSLQAGDDLILKRMKRRHNREQGLAVCRRAREARPGIALGADIIAGFPTEDEAMFARTLGLVAEAELDFVHVFPYSPRPGTPAARMPQLPGPVIHGRAAQLRTAALAAQDRFLAAQIGTSVQVLVEKSGLNGHAENFAAVTLDRYITPGEIAPARVTGAAANRLLAQVVS
jgi:threonylcarbamoyladenosine tRNA methylthiotransferase MtaB